MMRQLQWSSVAFALALLLAGENYALAGGRHGCRRCGTTCDAPCSAQAPCGTCGGTTSVPCEAAPAPKPAMVEKTIMVPTTETETRTIKVTEYTNETRQRTVKVMNRVPKTESVTKNFTVMVPKTETKTVNYNVCKPVVTEEKQQYTVNVPHTEQREGTRKVCKQVATTKKKSVTVDEGHWEGPAPAASAGGCASADACGGCQASCDSCDSGCGRRHRRWRTACASTCGSAPSGCAGPVWVPKLTQKEVEYTAYDQVWEDQKYAYNVCVLKPETRERTVKKCTMVTEQKSREETFTTCVPEVRSTTQEVTRYECVPGEKTETYTVKVPHEVEKQVQVRVCKMVPKTVQVPAGCDDGCGTAAGCGRGRRCRGC